MLKISKMSGKLEGLSALNTSPQQNEFCLKMEQNDNAICKDCYSLRMVRTYRKNAEKAWIENGNILSQIEIPYNLLPVINAAFFRYSSHGELINLTHLQNLINIARKNTHCTFALWTKRKDLINQALQHQECPENLILIFSQAETNHIPTAEEIPHHFHKIFAVIEDETDDRINCGNAKCLACLNCYRKAGPNIMIEYIKK